MNHRMHVREGDRRDVTGGHAVDALPVKQMKQRGIRRQVRHRQSEQNQIMEHLSRKKQNQSQRPPLASHVAAVKDRRKQAANGGGRRRRSGLSHGGRS